MVSQRREDESNAKPEGSHCFQNRSGPAGSLSRSPSFSAPHWEGGITLAGLMPSDGLKGAILKGQVSRDRACCGGVPDANLHGCSSMRPTCFLSG